jgi:hypothetical protein
LTPPLTITTRESRSLYRINDNLVEICKPIFLWTSLMNGTVYLIKNKETNKAYVGQARSWAKRKAVHLDPCNYETPELGKDLMRLGEEGFEWIELERDIQTQEELNRLEKLYIQKYDSVHPNGYNQVGLGRRRTKIVYSTPPKVALPELPENFCVNRSHKGAKVYYRWLKKDDPEQLPRTGTIWKVGRTIIYIIPDDPNAVHAVEWIRSFEDVLGLVEKT